ncbi:hypothetical protein Hokovirus_1_214 [Hokovirus HKV1]|uniref:Uncharacterized protein n=1 Tax=Hokovirus HKV1 TaxID=1977638 RepID=A0A1V0SF37_9VIRU|nr:hypothetical protein Hokovirus_1_214 [Hokovirus HKV1]
MGYDYYVDCDLIIKLNDLTSYSIRISHKGSYIYYSYDSDSEDDNKRQYLFELERIRKSNEKNDKLLYDNGKWLITAKNKINYYCDLIEENDISFGKVKSIEKKYFVIER